MFDFVKDKKRKKVIEELKQTKRHRRIDNFNNIRTVAIICRINNEQMWAVINHFTRILEERGKEVHIVAIVSNEQINSFVITHTATYVCHTKTDINFWGLPSGAVMEDFFGKKFDLLIDTVGMESFYSQYIALRSTASLKVVYDSHGDNPTDIYDMIIKGDGRIEVKQFLKIVVEYLSMIKK